MKAQSTQTQLNHHSLAFSGKKLAGTGQHTQSFFVYRNSEMLEGSLWAADAVLLVFSVQDSESFDKVALLRDMVRNIRGQTVPIVVVWNKTDLDRRVDRIQT